MTQRRYSQPIRVVSEDIFSTGGMNRERGIVSANHEPGQFLSTMLITFVDNFMIQFFTQRKKLT